MHTATVIYFAIQNLQNLAHVTQSHRLAQPPLGRLFTRTQRLRSPHVVTESDEEGDDLPIGLSSPAMQGRDNDFSPTSIMSRTRMPVEDARSKHGGRSVVGGFMSAQLRFPSVFRIEGQKSKRRLAP